MTRTTVSNIKLLAVAFLAASLIGVLAIAMPSEDADATPAPQCSYDGYITNPAQCPRQIVWTPQLPENLPTFTGFNGFATCAHVDPYQTWCKQIAVPANTPEQEEPAPAPIPVFTG
jgi:hypothetical protein